MDHGNHCKEHGIDNCRDCTQRQAAAQYFSQQDRALLERISRGQQNVANLMGSNEESTVKTESKGSLAKPKRATCGRCPCKELEAENDKLKMEIASTGPDRLDAVELESLRAQNEINRFAAENGHRKVVELEADVKRWKEATNYNRDIIQERTEEIENLRVALDVAKFVTNKKDEEILELKKQNTLLRNIIKGEE